MDFKNGGVLLLQLFPPAYETKAGCEHLKIKA